MFNLEEWLFGGGQNKNPMPNPINLPMPGVNNGMQTPQGGGLGMGMPGMNLGIKNPGSVPNYAAAAQAQLAQGIGTPPSNPAAQNTFPQQQDQNKQDTLRKMMLMQYLMGGEEDPQSAISPGQPSGSGMRGSGGFQNDPNMGLLNSFPPQLPQRKRFIGGSY